MIIALDGPAASGKGTIARKLAAHYGYAHLDTGSLYRAVALRVLIEGGDPSDVGAALEAARNLDPSGIDDQDLRSAKIGDAASIVAAMSGVRQAILAYQHDFAQTPPGAVLDGRDIGTVVCPDADVKIFVTATAKVRAHRRFLELKGRQPELVERDVLAMLEDRDSRDENRAIAPLTMAEDAHLLDTTNLDIEAAFQAAVEMIDRSI